MNGGHRVVGLDVTSTPTTRKPLTAAFAIDREGEVVVDRLERWDSFAPFERRLRDAAPVTFGVDAPLGLPRTFVEQTGWPPDWAGYVAAAGALDRAGLRTLLTAFMAPRPPGEKHLLRDTDLVAGAQSPLNAVRPPVALMFHELAPRLLAAPVSVLPCRPLDGVPARVVETYPALLVRSLVDGVVRPPPYKDGPPDATVQQARRDVRAALVRRLRRDAFPWALRVVLPDDLAAQLVEESTADGLDAVLCAVAASWARRRPDGGVPAGVDREEGWIVGAGVADE